MQVKLIKFPNFYKAPQRAHHNDSGADVFTTEDAVIYPHSSTAIPLGFGLEIPDGYDFIIHSKSGLSKQGIGCFNAPIDAGYKGEIHALVYNITDQPFYFSKGQKVGQLVCRPVIYSDFVDSLGEERKSGAFGSTGV